jgi:hypothetical protein
VNPRATISPAAHTIPPIEPEAPPKTRILNKEQPSSAASNRLGSKKSLDVRGRENSCSSMGPSASARRIRISTGACTWSGENEPGHGQSADSPRLLRHRIPLRAPLPQRVPAAHSLLAHLHTNARVRVCASTVSGKIPGLQWQVGSLDGLQELASYGVSLGLLQSAAQLKTTSGSIAPQAGEIEG